MNTERANIMQNLALNAFVVMAGLLSGTIMMAVIFLTVSDLLAIN